MRNRTRKVHALVLSALALTGMVTALDAAHKSPDPEWTKHVDWVSDDAKIQAWRVHGEKGDEYWRVTGFSENSFEQAAHWKEAPTRKAQQQRVLVYVPIGTVDGRHNTTDRITIVSKPDPANPGLNPKSKLTKITIYPGDPIMTKNRLTTVRPELTKHSDGHWRDPVDHPEPKRKKATAPKSRTRNADEPAKNPEQKSETR